METILLLTVGGSHEPILQAIKDVAPTYVCFLCSDDGLGTKGSYHQVIGEGKVLKSEKDLKDCDLPNIKALVTLRDDELEIIKIKNFDGLESCYEAAQKAMNTLGQRYPHARRIADYTGGTKSMTAGLAAAALDDETWEISLVTGERRNLTQVDRGSQYSMAVQVADLRMTRRLKAAAALLERFDYAGVLLTLESLARSPVSQDQQAALRRKIAICRAFDAWDRFDHQTAKHILEPYKGEFEAHYRFLRCLIGEAPPNAIARAEDLLLNVERRRTQARFDDAIARLYRCMELAAQIVLRFAHRIDTSALQLDQLPMEFRSNLSAEQTHKIGLIKSYELLLALESPLGFWYSKSRAQLLAWLETRNASILAHGSEPIGEQKYEDVGNLGYKLCREALDVAEKLFELPVPPTQLPAALPGLP